MELAFEKSLRSMVRLAGASYLPCSRVQGLLPPSLKPKDQSLSGLVVLLRNNIWGHSILSAGERPFDPSLLQLLQLLALRTLWRNMLVDGST